MARSDQELRFNLSMQDQLSPQLQKPEQALKNVGREAKAAAKSMNLLRSGMVNLGVGFAQFAGGALGIYSVTAAFADAQVELANISTLFKGDATEAIKTLEKQIDQLSVTTGESFVELSTAAYNTISAFGAVDNAFDIMRISSETAIGGLASTEEALLAIAAVTKGYGDTSTAAAEKASDLLLTTVRLGQTTLPELSASIQRVVPLANTLGVGFEEVSAVFATLTGVSGNTAEVSTQLNAVLTALLKPQGEFKKFLDEIQWTARDVKVSLGERGLVGTLQHLKEVAASSGKDLTTLFTRKEAIQGVAQLDSNLTTFNEKLNEMGESFGARAEAAGKQINTMRREFNGARAAVAAVRKAIGASFEQPIRTMSRWVKVAADLFFKMSENAQELTGKLITFGFAIPLVGGSLRIMLGSMQLSLGIFANFISRVLHATAAIWGMVAALGAKIAALGILKAPLIAIGVGVAALGVAIVQMASKGTPGINRIIAGFLNVADVIRTGLTPVVKFLRKRFAELGPFLVKMAKSLVGFAETLNSLLPEFLQFDMTSIKAKLTKLGEIVKKALIDKFKGLVGEGEFNALVERMMERNGKDYLTMGQDAALNFINGLKDTLGLTNEEIKESIEKMFNVDFGNISTPEDMAGLLSGNADLTDFSVNLPVEVTGTDEAKDKLDDLVDHADQQITTFSGQIRARLKQAQDQIVNTQVSLANITMDTFDNMSDALADFVVDGEANFKDLIKAMIKELIRLAITQAMLGGISAAMGAFGSGPAPSSGQSGGAINFGPGSLGPTTLSGPGFAQGGKVEGPTGKATPAIVHGGEYVFTPEQMDSANSLFSALGAMYTEQQQKNEEQRSQTNQVRADIHKFGSVLEAQILDPEIKTEVTAPVDDHSDRMMALMSNMAGDQARAQAQSMQLFSEFSAPPQPQSTDSNKTDTLARAIGGMEPTQVVAPRTTVNVINNANNTETRQEESKDSDGNTKLDIIIETVENRMSQNIRNGGGLSPVLEKQFGLDRSKGGQT
jgi:TP901 family phage tail tape measure protein